MFHRLNEDEWEGEEEMNSMFEKIVKELNLIPIDDTFRNVHKATYGHAIDEKYKYRTLGGDRVYSPKYLLNMCKEGEGE